MKEKTFESFSASDMDDLDDGLSYCTSRGPLDITEENLEDLLAYDDLFLDYFNAFLSLPVFATPLYYNRLTGTFLEAEGPGLKRILGVENTVSPPYGATDEEREAMLQWAKEERLPLFLRTQLFREFKLCKLLLRPLDERYSAGRGGSSKIRGYSRQTESYVSSLSNSVDNSAQDADFEDEGGGGWEPTYRRSVLYRYPRPGSRAFSLPSRVGLGPYGLKSQNNSANRKAGSFIVNQASGETHDSKRRSSHSANAKKLEKENTTDFNPPTTQERIAAVPVPEKSLYDPIISSSKEVTFHKDDDGVDQTRVLSATSVHSKASLSGRSRSGKTVSKMSKRVPTPKHRKGIPTPSDDKENEQPDVVIADYDLAFGEMEPPPTAEALVEFGDDAVSEAQTEKDVEQLEGKHKMSLQAMKEQMLGSVGGMEQFRDFLFDTPGSDLYHFWMDCEYYKDSMEEYDEEENLMQRNSLFRDIQDRYKLSLTNDARKQIQMAARDSGLSHTVFIRTQYDILRRLRMYWLPRLLIHKERTCELRLKAEKNMELLTRASTILFGEQYLMSRQASSFFPSISVARSMPVKAEDALQIAKTTNWETVCKGGKQTDARVKSAKPHLLRRAREPSMREMLVLALIADKAAGGPFRQFLERNRNQHQNLCNMLFWQDVTEYGQAEDRSADRLLRMVHAWNIYNLYLSEDSRFCIGLNAEQRDNMHMHLLKCKDLVGVDVFAEAKEHAVQQLEKSWIRFLKEDMKAFIDAHLSNSDGPPTTASEYEVVLDKSDNQLNLYVTGPRPWIKRPRSEERYPPSTASERGERLHTAISVAETIDAAKKAERRKKARERRDMVEKERKKAIKEAKKMMRQKHSKKPKSSRKSKDEDGEEDAKSQAVTQTEGRTYSQSDNRLRGDGASEEAERQPTFAESVKKNKSIMVMLKKFVQENEGKDVKDMLNMYLDIDAYQHIEKDKANKINKDKQATFIFKTYIDPSSKKRVQVSDKVHQKMKAEKERPKSPTLRDCQSSVVATLEEAFAKFWTNLPENEKKTQQEIYGDGKNMGHMSKAELAMRAEDLSLMTGWKGKGGPAGGGGKGHRGGRPDGRAQPTREDQVEFLLQLTTASAGHLPIMMLYFYKYLVKYSEDESTYLTALDRDLFFYFEVQKFKDGSHQYADEELLKRKVQSLLDCYLESNSTPAVQINVPSDISGKASRAANKYLQGKEVNSTLFDEAQFAVFKNLLPYWSGFNRTYKPPADDKKPPPMTKPQRERKKRLEEIKAWQPPTASTVSLPSLPKGANVAAFTFSVAEGVKWRDATEQDQEDTIIGSNNHLREWLTATSPTQQ